MTIGRPSEYTPEIETKICELIAEGKSLSEICRADDMPSRETVYAWKAKNQAFSDRYARAVEDRAEKLAEEILTISDDDSGDFGFKRVKNEDGESAEVFIDKDNIQRAKLRVDSRKWIASKLFPKKYGDKVQNELTGAEGGPIEFGVTVSFIKAPDGSASQG